MTNIRTITQPLLQAQLRHTAEMALTIANYDGPGDAYSDDGMDYMMAALSLSGQLLTIDYECNEAALAALFDPLDDAFFMNEACDGVAPELHDYAKSLDPDYEAKFEAHMED